MTESPRSVIPWLIGIGSGIVFLTLTLANIDSDSVARVLASVDLRWTVLAVCAFISALLVRASRWRELLRPMRQIRYVEVAKPLLVGFALNYIFPARLGELFRAHYARDGFSMSGSSVLGTIVAERAFDLLAVVLFLVAGILTALKLHTDAHSLPWVLLKSAIVILVLTAVGAASLWLMQRSKVMQGYPVLNRRAVDFSEGLHTVFKSRMLLVIAASAAVSSLEALAIWSMVAAAGISLSAGEIALVLGFVSLSTLIPNSPGFLGTFQFAFYVSLTLMGYDGAHGVIAATLAQLFLFLPVTIIGITLLFRSGISMRYIRKS